MSDSRSASGSRRGVVTVGEDVAPEVRAAVAFILRSTSARPRTEAEIRTRLAARDVDPAVAEEAVVAARRVGALDDRAFAVAWVEERGVRGGQGAARLRADLRRRLVPEPLVDEALAALEARDDVAAATDLARRRARQLPVSLAPEAVVRRLTAYLVRRGHPPALAQRVAISVSGIDRDWD